MAKGAHLTPVRGPRRWLVLPLALLCCATTAAGVQTAVWLDRLAPILRMPAGEPGTATTRALFPTGPRGETSGPALPHYRKGDFFEFQVREPSSDGQSLVFDRKWQVEAIHGDRIDWSIGGTASMTTTLNPLVPPLRWRAMEDGEGSRQLRGDPLALFPLEKGKKAAVSSIGGPASVRDVWECEAAGQEQVTVTAGSFRAWRVECANQSASAKETYYFADEVGFWVSRISRLQRGTESIDRVYELTASSRLRR